MTTVDRLGGESVLCGRRQSLRPDGVKRRDRHCAGTGTACVSGDNGVANMAQLDTPRGSCSGPGGKPIHCGQPKSASSDGFERIDNHYSGHRNAWLRRRLRSLNQWSVEWTYGVAIDSMGNLCIAERGGQRVRMILNGVITTVAGTGAQGFSGEGGPATSAQLSSP